MTVEILPPRTSVTCAAPSAQDAALGRGLFDVAAADAAHGSYLADLRLAVAGSDAHVDGVQLDLTAPEGASAAVTDAAGAVDGTNTGDVLLYGSSDDVRRAVVENVELLTRDLAVALGDDSGLDLSATQYATVELTLTPVVRDAGFTAASTTFALDVCKGCLVDAPSTDECPAGAVATSVCRLGQDVDSFTCATGVVP